MNSFKHGIYFFKDFDDKTTENNELGAPEHHASALRCVGVKYSIMLGSLISDWCDSVIRPPLKLSERKDVHLEIKPVNKEEEERVC